MIGSSRVSYLESFDVITRVGRFQLSFRWHSCDSETRTSMMQSRPEPESRRQIVLVWMLILGILVLGPGKGFAIDDPKPIVDSGASFSEPKGWVRLPGRTKTKGYFISGDSDRLNPHLMILVDIGRPSLPTLQATAEGLAKGWKGKVLDETTTLDGVKALRVRVEEQGPGLKPVEAVLTLHEGRIYILMGGTVPGRSVIDQVEEVRKGWKWVP